MSSTRVSVLMGILMLCVAFSSAAQSVSVANGSFENGTGSPEGWTLVGGKGAWLNEGSDGTHAISASGEGKGNSYWQSEPQPLQPNTVYTLQFYARVLDGSGGCVTTGPAFCNCDLDGVGKDWTRFTSNFITPSKIDAELSRLRFGQWERNGSVAYDAVKLIPSQPVYLNRDGFVLGEGERITGNAYEFRAPFGGESRNQSRPLAEHQCVFNTGRWVFATGSFVVYRQEVASRKHTKAEVETNIGYYTGGELVVEAGTDGQSWREIGSQTDKGSRTFAVPAGLFPAERIWVRLRARTATEKPDLKPGEFQVYDYVYRATLDGAPVSLGGSTHFFRGYGNDPRVNVHIESLGACIPGGANALEARIENRSQETVKTKAVLSFAIEGSGTSEYGVEAEIKPGANAIRIPYTAPNAGASTATLRLEGLRENLRFETSIFIPYLYEAGYGARLPQSRDGVTLWIASSGWKIAQTRPAPDATCEAIELSAAANEGEAVQLVARPTAALHGFRIVPEALRGAGGATIPSDRIDVLRVRYVNVTQPTDGTGVAAPWPDPLPKLAQPLDLSPGLNHPFWIRVNVPADAKPGVYEGMLDISAEGFSAKTPLRVKVYGFALPDRMTCTSAFGFDVPTVFRYQNLKDPAQQREVLEKYWKSFSAHHISPYNPAPLDPFETTWPNASTWQGGERDAAERHGGETSLVLRDDNRTTNVSCRCTAQFTIPEKGFKLSIAYKTREPGQIAAITLNHFDANKQWMSGRNNDIHFAGDGQWQIFTADISAFPEGATAASLTLWAAPYAEDGSTTGTTWFDDVSLKDAETGEGLMHQGGFEPTREMDLTPSFKWDAWDTAMTRAFGQYHFNAFSLPVPGLGGGTFYSRTEPSLLGYAENTPQYKAAFAAYCRGAQEHLREKGWLNDAYVYWFDEPEPRDYPFVMNGFRKLKEAAPDIHRMLTEEVVPELVDGPNIWCPLTPNFDAEKCAPRMAAGDKFWWYVCCGPKAPYCTLFLDHPATELRVWLWQTWQRGINGILVWDTNYWTSEAAYPASMQNPYEDCMSWTSGYGTPAGTKLPWGNGDGRFLYPPESAADASPAQPVLEGPVDSIRWEMLRDGLEDYEYMVILKRLLDERGDKLTQEQRAAYSTLLEVPEAITANITMFTTDPQPIEEHRNAVAEAIEALAGLQRRTK